MEDLKLIFRNGQPLFKAYGIEGIMLHFDEIEGQVIPTPGNPEGETMTMWGYLTVVLESEQKLLQPSSSIGRVGHVGWRANGFESQLIDNLVSTINQAIDIGKETSLNDAVFDICNEFFMLPPFCKWKFYYDFDFEEFQEKKKLVNGYNAELIKNH